MRTREKYLKIVKTLDSGSVGAPLTSELMEMLQLCFPPGPMLDMAVLLELKEQPLHVLAKRAGMTEENAHRLLEKMAARGTIWGWTVDGEDVYRMSELMAGIMEYVDVSPVWDPEEKEKFKKLWRLYYKKAMCHEQGLSEVSLLHVMPASESFNPNVIYPYENLIEMVKKQKGRIALQTCMCRDYEHNCNHLMETCLAFNEGADYVLRYHFGREITVDECIDVLKRCEEDGLVHQGTNNQEKLLFVCNCCSCCCNLMQPYTVYKYPYGTTTSSVYASIHEDQCIGCGTCKSKRCPVEEAIVLDPNTKKASVNENFCLGCGLCQTACPVHAIELVPRKVMPVSPETIGDMVKIVRRIKDDHRKDPDYIPGMR